MGDQFIVLVATHLNSNHYHNHFVICSTSTITGRRFNKCDRDMNRMKDCSDKLCREYGLHVIENKGKSKSKTQVEAALEKKGIPTHNLEESKRLLLSLWYAVGDFGREGNIL